MANDLIDYLNRTAGSLFFQTLVATCFGAFMGSWSAFRFEQSARRRRKLNLIVVSGNQALTTLRRYYFAILQYGQNRDRLYGDIGGDVEPARLEQADLGFLFAYGFPDAVTKLFEAQDLSLSVLAKIRRFAEIRPASGNVNVETASEFNALQRQINQGMGRALPALTGAIKSLHSIMKHKLPSKYATQLIAVDDIGPEAEMRRERERAQLLADLSMDRPESRD